MDELRKYSSQEIELACKLNIPSIGTYNAAQSYSRNSTFIHRFVSSCPVPVIHYQRSHMKLFDSLFKEYVERGDYSRENHEKGNKKPVQLKFNMKGFLNDFMVMFTDYQDPKEEESVTQEKYLARYKGLIFNLENLCIRTILTIKKVKDQVICAF